MKLFIVVAMVLAVLGCEGERWEENEEIIMHDMVALSDSIWSWIGQGNSFDALEPVTWGHYFGDGNNKISVGRTWFTMVSPGGQPNGIALIGEKPPSIVGNMSFGTEVTHRMELSHDWALLGHRTRIYEGVENTSRIIEFR